MSTEVMAHVWVDDAGVAWVDQTNVKVIEVVLDKLAHGSSAEEMHFQYPHLSLAQIYAALSYYCDHQAELDAEIQRHLREVDALKAQQTDSPVLRKLREAGKLP